MSVTQQRFAQVKDSEFASQAELDAAIVGTKNYVINPGAESDLTGVTASGANLTVTRTTTSGEALRGSGGFKIEANGSQSVGDYIQWTTNTLDEIDKIIEKYLPK